MNLERRNAYFCNSCRKVIITVDVDEGVTPMFIPCIHCNHAATSMMYQIPGCLRFNVVDGVMQDVPADLEWYKPNKKEIKTLSKSLREHVHNGGLLFRKRTNTPIILNEKIKK